MCNSAQNLLNSKHMQRAKTNQIGALSPSIHGYLQCTLPQLITGFNILHSFHYRDSIYAKFKVNRSEMWALLSLHGLLTIKGKVIISRKTLVDYLSGNFKQRSRFCGFYNGLLEKKCIGAFEYISSPGSLSYGISDFGFEVINAYYAEMNHFFARYMNEREEVKQVIPYPNIETDVKSISVEENIPKTHKYKICA